MWIRSFHMISCVDVKKGKTHNLYVKTKISHVEIVTSSSHVILFCFHMVKFEFTCELAHFTCHAHCVLCPCERKDLPIFTCDIIAFHVLISNVKRFIHMWKKPVTSHVILLCCSHVKILNYSVNDDISHNVTCHGLFFQMWTHKIHIWKCKSNLFFSSLHMWIRTFHMILCTMFCVHVWQKASNVNVYNQNVKMFLYGHFHSYLRRSHSLKNMKFTCE